MRRPHGTAGVTGTDGQQSAAQAELQVRQPSDQGRRLNVDAGSYHSSQQAEALLHCWQ